MSTINRVLVAFLTFTSSPAIPLDSSVADSARIETLVEIHTRSLLSQLPESDQPRLARNSLRSGDLPVITLPYGHYRATKYVEEIDVCRRCLMRLKCILY